MIGCGLASMPWPLFHADAAPRTRSSLEPTAHSSPQRYTGTDTGADVSRHSDDRNGASATGASAAEAKKAAEETEARLRAYKEQQLAKKKQISEDEKRIAEFCKANPDAVDNVGRRQCK